MPKQRISDDIWTDRLSSAKKYRKEWENKYKVPILYKYYRGMQWRIENLDYNPYTINKIYETIQIKIAQFIPTFPKFIVGARPGNEQFDMKAAGASANLKEDLLNQICSDNKLKFTHEIEQAYKESFFAFGLCEVGYSADWILNPQAQLPLKKSDTDKLENSSNSPRILESPLELPKNEQVFIKHIPARHFLIGGFDSPYLARCGWCGYYEYVNKYDLLTLPKLMNRDKIDLSYQFSTEDGIINQETDKEDKTKEASGSNVKLWHIWDQRSQNKILLLDSPSVTLFQRHFDFFPLFEFSHDKDPETNGFYPIPPVFHWLSPQDEYNETREMLRAHRRKFIRKFQVMEGRIDDGEIEKFETGADGALIKVKSPEAITPIQSADLGRSVDQTIATSADDLNRISGTTDESRGVADRTTATQATIVNQRTALRETKERDRIVSWYCQIGRAILLIVNSKFTGKILVKMNANEGIEDYLGTVQERQTEFRYILAEDLNDGYDFKIDIDLTSLSAVARDEEKKRLFEFTAYLTQNPAVSFSPYLIREAAIRIGYRNERCIAEFQKQALLMELARQLQIQAQIGQLQSAVNQIQNPQMPQNGNAPQQMLQQATPPEQEQITNQLQRTLPLATQ